MTKRQIKGIFFGNLWTCLCAAFLIGARLCSFAQAPEVKQGQIVYQKHCASCHGPRGEGGKGPTLAQPTLVRASDDASLYRIISGGVPGTEMPPAKLEPIEFYQVVTFVKSLGAQPCEKVRGDPKRGAELYASKGACAQCHTLRSEGGNVGPDLTDIGRRRSADYLRRALVEPSADVPQSFTPFRSEVSLPENFVAVRIKTKEGAEIAGVRVNEDTFSIQMRDANGRLHSFYKAEVAEFVKDWGKSPMASYAETFTKEELDDVVAFLVSLRDGK